MQLSVRQLAVRVAFTIVGTLLLQGSICHAAFGSELPTLPRGGAKMDSLVIVAPQVTCESPSKQAEWNQAVLRVCRLLGENLTLGKGPWKLGPFRSVACEIPGRESSAAEKLAASSADWRMFMTLDQKKSLRFQMSYLPREKNASGSDISKKFEASARIPYSSRTLLLLAQRSFSRAVAAVLLDQLPFAGQVQRKNLQDAPPVQDSSLAPIDFPGNREGWSYLPLSYNEDSDAWTIEEATGAASEVLKIVNVNGRGTQIKPLSDLIAEKYRTLTVNEAGAPGETCGKWQTEKPVVAAPAVSEVPPPPSLPIPEVTASAAPEPETEVSRPSRSFFGWDAEPYFEAGAGAFGNGANNTSSSSGSMVRLQPFRHALSALLFTGHFLRTQGSLGVRIRSPESALPPVTVLGRGEYRYREWQVGMSHFTTFPVWGPYGFGAGLGLLAVSQGLKFVNFETISLSNDEARDVFYGVLSLRGGPLLEMGNVSARMEGVLSSHRLFGKEYEERGVNAQVAYTFIGQPPSARLSDLDFSSNLGAKDPFRVWAFFLASYRDALVSKNLARTSSTVESVGLRLVTTQTLMGAGVGLGW